MKNYRRLTAFLLALSLCIGAMLCTYAAHKDLAEVSARTGLEPVGTFRSNAELVSSSEALPAYYSSKDAGLTLQVRQQHQNTCWAFGTLSSFETLLLNNSEENIEIFAPQHANYWGITRSDGTGWQRSFSDAGYAFIPLGYLTSWAGPLNEADFPEQTSTQEDYNSLTLSPKYGLTEAVYINNSTDRNVIKELILSYGSVVASFNSDFSYLSGSTSFYCGDSTLGVSQLMGHCVSVVGWDDNYSKDNFSESKSGTPANNGAWLVKNSWGTNINDLGGCYWISYEDVWIFDDIFGPSYALTDYETLCEDVKLYQNEIDGATYEFSYFSYSENRTVTYINAFDFSNEHRTLDKVVFESTALGCDYSVYYIPFDGSTPSADTDVWEELYTSVVDYTGYICVDIEDTKLPAGKGAIGVKISNTRVNKENPSADVLNSIGVCEWLESGKGMIFLPQAEAGLSYYMDMDRPNSEVRDVMDFYADSLYDDIGGTFVIKAITRNECVAPHPTEPAQTTPVTTETATATESTVTDPTETTTLPVVTTTKPIETTVPVTTVTSPTAASDPTESTAEITTMATTAPATTVTTSPVTSLTFPTETTTGFDIAEPFVYILGDADLSGQVNIKDATLIQKSAASLATLTSREFMAADVNKNKDANIVDATYIQKFAASIKTDIAVGQECVFFE